MPTREEFDQHYSKAQQGDGEAQYIVGKYYLERQDTHNAKSWLTKSAEQGNIDAQFDLARLLIKDSSDDTLMQAVSFFINAANKYEDAKKYLLVDSDAYKQLVKIADGKGQYQYYSPNPSIGKACYLLAKIHISDLFSSKNVSQAIKYYEQALELKHMQAGQELGELYYQGVLVKKSYPDALRIFRKINEDNYQSRNEPNSCYFLGKLHEMYDAIKNNDKAIEYYERSVSNKGRGSLDLGRLCYNKYRNEQTEYGKRSAKEKAIHYLKEFSNDANSNNYLGLIYYEDKKYREAAILFEKAGTQGLTVGYYNLAITCKDDQCGPENTKLVVISMKKAAEAGYATAQYELAGFYKSGRPALPKDLVEAFIWMQKAADGNHDKAKAELQDSISPLSTYKKMYDVVKDKLGYSFLNVRHLIAAFNRTHNSVKKEAEYQRYEFVGDGILNSVIRTYIEEHAPVEMSTAQLNDIYMKMVANKTILPLVAKELQLGNFIIFDPTERDHTITDKMLADVCEALIGAIAKDEYPKASSAQKMILKLWGPFIEKEMTAAIAMQKAKVSGAQVVPPVAKTPTVMPHQPSKSTSSSAAASSRPAPVQKATPITAPLSPNTQRMFCSLGASHSIEQFEADIKKVSDINQRNIGKKGNTALMMLLSNQTLRADQEIPKIKALLRHGALWTATNNSGESADVVALKHHDSAVISRLKKG